MGWTQAELFNLGKLTRQRSLNRRLSSTLQPNRSLATTKYSSSSHQWFQAQALHTSRPVCHNRQQRNRRSQFARAVHPWWRRNDPFCCVTLFADPTEWSVLLLYNAICSERVTIRCQWGGKTPKLPLPLGISSPSHGHTQHAQKNW